MESQVIKIEELNDAQIAKCSDCGRWEYLSKGAIRHSSRCDFTSAQAAQWTPKPKASVSVKPNANYRSDSPASGLTSDEVYDDYKRGYISQSDAMNTDF